MVHLGRLEAQASPAKAYSAPLKCCPCVISQCQVSKLLGWACREVKPSDQILDPRRDPSNPPLGRTCRILQWTKWAIPSPPAFGCRFCEWFFFCKNKISKGMTG